jgi:hypothetical protein
MSEKFRGYYNPEAAGELVAEHSDETGHSPIVQEAVTGKSDIEPSEQV